ncbi:MAG TPA: cytochrome c [Acidimicrobiia bacterium]|nr:cytochrome c [Acidimicrobiia bacterium]
MFTRIVNGVEVVALLAVGVFLVLLFANEPEEAVPAPVGTTTVSDGAGAEGGDERVDGAAVFASHCARCHGAAGEGLTAPALFDGRVARAFPDVANQIAFVKAGGGGMPSFGSLLSDAEIEAVVRYTRDEL